MSIELFYPDNRLIAGRVQGLVNDIVNLQGQAISIDDDMNKLQADTLAKLKAYAKQAGIISVDDAKARIKNLTSEDFMNQVEDYFSARKSANENMTNAIEWVLFSAFAMSGIKTGITVLEAVKTCTAVDLIKDIFTAFRLMGNRATFQEGTAFIKALPSLIKKWQGVWEVEQEGTLVLTVSRVAQGVASVVAALGVALDLVLIITAAIEGAKQKEQLIDSLKNLFTRRILVKMTVMQSQIPLDWIGQVSAIVTVLQYVKDTTTAQSTVAVLEKEVLDGMQTEKNLITFDKVYQLLKTHDGELQAYQDYDPSLADARAYSDSLPSDDTVASSNGAVKTSAKPQTTAEFFPVTHNIRKQALHTQSIQVKAFGFGDLTGAISSGFNGAASAVSGAASTAASSVAVFPGQVFGQFNDAVPMPTADQIKSGDIFWPDNPKRKVRVQELIDDLGWIQAQLNDIKRNMAGLGSSLRPNLDACMKAMGLESFSALEAAIVTRCSSGDVAKWRDAKAKMDQNDQIEGSVFQVVDIVAATVGVVGIVLEFVNPPVGSALIATAIAIDIASQIVHALVNIIEGAQIRDKCDAAIHNLIPARLAARMAYEKMTIMQEWMKTVNITMNAFEKTMTRNQAAALINNIHLLSDSMVIKYQSFGPNETNAVLSQMDRSRNSFTNDDH